MRNAEFLRQEPGDEREVVQHEAEDPAITEPPDARTDRPGATAHGRGK